MFLWNSPMETSLLSVRQKLRINDVRGLQDRAYLDCARLSLSNIPCSFWAGGTYSQKWPFGNQTQPSNSPHDHRIYHDIQVLFETRRRHIHLIFFFWPSLKNKGKRFTKILVSGSRNPRRCFWARSWSCSSCPLVSKRHLLQLNLWRCCNRDSSASLQLGSHRQKCLDDTLSGPFCLEKVPEMKFLTVYLVAPAVSAALGGN